MPQRSCSRPERVLGTCTSCGTPLLERHAPESFFALCQKLVTTNCCTNCIARNKTTPTNLQIQTPNSNMFSNLGNPTLLQESVNLKLQHQSIEERGTHSTLKTGLPWLMKSSYFCLAKGGIISSSSTVVAAIALRSETRETNRSAYTLRTTYQKPTPLIRLN